MPKARRVIRKKSSICPVDALFGSKLNSSRSMLSGSKTKRVTNSGGVGREEILALAPTTPRCPGSAPLVSEDALAKSNSLKGLGHRNATIPSTANAYFIAGTALMECFRIVNGSRLPPSLSGRRRRGSVGSGFSELLINAIAALRSWPSLEIRDALHRCWTAGQATEAENLRCAHSRSTVYEKVAFCHGDLFVGSIC